jgi:hypothetical protein
VFLRFVVDDFDTNDIYWLDGIFTLARILRDDGELYAYETDILNKAFEWFNDNLPCPPFGEKIKKGEWSRNALSWFRDEAQEMIEKIWDIVAILREHGKHIRLLKSENPGKIVYSDRYQIVAETPRWHGLPLSAMS